jgi:hypothetical protein
MSLTCRSELIDFTKYMSYYSRSSPHTNLLIVKGHFKFLFIDPIMPRICVWNVSTWFQFHEELPRLVQYYLCVFLFKTFPAERIFLPILKSLMNLEHEHQDTSDQTFFHKMYRLFFQINLVYKNALFVYMFPHLTYYCEM